MRQLVQAILKALFGLKRARSGQYERAAPNSASTTATFEILQRAYRETASDRHKPIFTYEQIQEFVEAFNKPAENAGSNAQLKKNIKHFLKGNIAEIQQFKEDGTLAAPDEIDYKKLFLEEKEFAYYGNLDTNEIKLLLLAKNGRGTLWRTCQTTLRSLPSYDKNRRAESFLLQLLGLLR